MTGPLATILGCMWTNCSVAYREWLRTRPLHPGQVRKKRADDARKARFAIYLCPACREGWVASATKYERFARHTEHKGGSRRLDQAELAVRHVGKGRMDFTIAGLR